MTLKIRATRIDFFVDDIPLRIPFSFGNVTVRSLPICLARCEASTETGDAVGCSSDLLVPRWFRRDEKRSTGQDSLDLLESAEQAAAVVLAPDFEPMSVFDAWRELYERRVQHTDFHASDRLVRGFGVALVERALVDAACRAAGLPLRDALENDLLGFRPGEVHPELEGWTPDVGSRDFIRVRHTIGMQDLLADQGGGNAPPDGLPFTLKQDMDAYGVREFKIKIGGDPARDRPRLLEIAAVLEEQGLLGCPVTLDANEQYPDLGDLVALLSAVSSTGAGEQMLQGLRFVEQPLPREVSFDVDACRGLAAVSEFAPVLIDEADVGVEAFPRALDLGYRGVSFKNCKGLFRGMLNRGIVSLGRGGAFQSAEDLTNLPVVALQQNLAALDVLGFDDAEMNGHHYFNGLQHLPPDESRNALASHPGLYHRTENGVFLSIRGGEVDLRDVRVPGFGCDVPIEFQRRTPADEWRSSPS